MKQIFKAKTKLGIEIQFNSEIDDKGNIKSDYPVEMTFNPDKRKTEYFLTLNKDQVYNLLKINFNKKKACILLTDQEAWEKWKNKAYDIENNITIIDVSKEKYNKEDLIKISEVSERKHDFRIGLVIYRDGKYLVVIESGHYYISEDGWSFGLMAESGYVYWAKCREAKNKESVVLRRKRERVNKIKIKKKQAKESLLKIQKEIERIENYVHTEEQITLSGSKYCDNSNVYGGGSWFIVNNKYIWFIVNNGMDGDDWSRNNIRTGGAGGIGYRVDYDKILEEALKSIDVVLFNEEREKGE